MSIFINNPTCNIASSSFSFILSNYDSAVGHTATFVPIGSGMNVWNVSISIREDSSVASMEVLLIQASNNCVDAIFIFPSFASLMEEEKRPRSSW